TTTSGAAAPLQVESLSTPRLGSRSATTKSTVHSSELPRRPTFMTFAPSPLTAIAEQPTAPSSPAIRLSEPRSPTLSTRAAIPTRSSQTPSTAALNPASTSMTAAPQTPAASAATTTPQVATQSTRRVQEFSSAPELATRSAPIRFITCPTARWPAIPVPPHYNRTRKLELRPQNISLSSPHPTHPSGSDRASLNPNRSRIPHSSLLLA